MITKDLNLLECIAVITGAIPLGGLIGYGVAAIRQLAGFEPSFGSLIMHFSQLSGIGTAAFVVIDRLPTL